MEEGECSSSLDFEINQLRGRLDRRNALLDIIRKAYHRDVLVVKEHLQRQGINTNDTNSLLIDDLSSVPSIDLRETFRLFAPHECELRVRPCFSCGGQLEIIHRESARIVDFKYAIKVLQELEKELRLELVGAKVEAQKDRVRLVGVVENSKDEREVLLDQILSLKHQVADRNALEVEVQQLKVEKSNLESTLDEQKPILIDHERLLVEIEQVKDERKKWQEKFHEQVEKNSLLQSEKDSLSHDFDLLEDANKQLQSNLDEVRKQYNQSTDQCTTLTNGLSKSQTETMEAEDCLYKAEQAIDELETNLQNEKEQHQSQINDLESKCLELQSTIAELERISQKNLTEALYYRRKIDATLQGAKRRGSIAIVPSNRDAVLAKTDELIRECDTLRHKSTMLFNLLLGCIRTTYENCLVQEKLLSENGSELYRNSQNLKSSSEPTNEQARSVLNHLDTADESDTIDWISILKDETDQRHIMGNLQNRLQLGQFSLDKAFQKVCKTHEAEVLKHQAEHDTEIEQRRLRSWELEQMLTDAISLNRKYEDKMTIMREKYETVELQHDSIKTILRKMRRDSVDNNTLTSQLKDDYTKMKSLTNQLLSDIKSAKEEIQAQRADLADKQEDITNRDAAITQLETLLERITHRYAENEKKRIKVTHEVATQAVPTVVNTSTHADFLPTPLGSSASSVAANDVENRKPRGGGGDALLPGRIYKLSDENESWPSRISIPAKRTSLSFRRLIDKL